MSDWFKNSIKVKYDYFVLCMNLTLLTNYCSHSKSANQSIHKTFMKKIEVGNSHKNDMKK